MKKNSAAIAEIPGKSFAYIPKQGFWDEAVSAAGHPRRHWRKLAVTIGRMGHPQLARAWQTGCRIIQDAGITYNLSSSGHSDMPLWRMDPLPLLISGEEWGNIEQAIIQRATLLNKILADCYGQLRPQDRQLIDLRYEPGATT